MLGVHALGVADLERWPRSLLLAVRDILVDEEIGGTPRLEGGGEPGQSVRGDPEPDGPAELPEDLRKVADGGEANDLAGNRVTYPAAGAAARGGGATAAHNKRTLRCTGIW